jgi:hypothetical protein
LPRSLGLVSFYGLRVLGSIDSWALGDCRRRACRDLGWPAIATGIVWLAAALGLWALQPWARLFAMFIAGLALFAGGPGGSSSPGPGVALG